MNIKKMLFSLVAIVALSVMVQAQSSTTGWVEEKTTVAESSTTPRLQGLINHSFTKEFGTFVWFQVDSRYAEAYAGVTYSPKEWIQFAGGVGVEQAGKPLRVGGYVWAGKGRFSGLLILEGLGSGFWCAAEGNVKLNKFIGLGAMSRRFEGTGPRVEFSLPKTPLKVWGAVLFQNQSTNTTHLLIGVRMRF